MSSTTMTIRVSADIKEKLDRLAADTRRSRSFLAAEAVSAYVARELAIVEGINEGLDDVRNGRTVPHDEAMSELASVIEAAGRDRS
ncbi:CopG family ribbon-helix-helix protein [Shinella zoogloeoides]|uniref:CopG family ribbon-helix-helix protein n=1 Tax=Shinella zoogloeoides TaxID=352475 RepID=UPI00273F8D4E|nr:CopG family ribbon-helix-helix protein [Shinella zoogloeoides]WLR93608.1 CopG family ribbon-helix-helix protein [Shinella zoogloeoides]